MPVCEICNSEFVPNKYSHGRQRVCSSAECQSLRQRRNIQLWLSRNSDYFKIKRQDPLWLERARQSNRLWRQNHTEELKVYRQSRKEQHREYMRAYMRLYRQRLKER